MKCNSINNREITFIGASLLAYVLVYIKLHTVPFFFFEIFGLLDNIVVTSLDSFYNRMLSFKGILQRPLSVFSFAINYRIFGDDPQFYHAVNFVIHGINAFLIFLLAKRLGSNKYVALLMAALHPLATGVVCKIYGRSYSLAALFMMLGLLIFLKWDQSGKWNKFKYSSLGGLFVLMLLSKQTFVFFPAVVLWYKISQDKNFSMRSFAKSKSALYSGIASVLIVSVFIIFHGIKYSATASLNPYAFFISQLGNTQEFIDLFIFGENIYAYNALPIYSTYLTPQVLFGAGALLVWLSLVIKFRHTRLAFLQGCMLLALIPTNSFFPKNEIMYDWRMYPAFLFLCLSFAEGFSVAQVNLQKNKTMTHLLYATAVMYIAYLGGRTYRQVDTYQNLESAYMEALKEYPHSDVLAGNLGFQISLERSRWDEALIFTELATKLNPEITGWQNNVKIMRGALERPKK